MAFRYCGKHQSYTEGRLDSLDCRECKREQEKKKLENQVDIIAARVLILIKPLIHEILIAMGKKAP